MEEKNYTDEISVRHVLIIISCIMITFGPSALTFSTWSAFQAVVPDLLGVEKSTWALYVTVLYLVEAAAAPTIGKLLEKHDIRIMLTASAILVGCGFLFISLMKTMWAFYVAGVLMGLGEVSIMWLAVPTLANSWFNQKSGTIVGVSMAFTGIGGAFWLQVFNALYASGAGMSVWSIYTVWGIAALVCALPFTIFCVRKTPQEAGQLPYGKPITESGKPIGIDAAKAFKSPVFYTVLIFAGLINLLTIVAQQFPSYTKSLTDVTFDALSVGVMMSTVMMAAQAIFKLCMGPLADKSAKGSFFAACICGIVGVVLVWFGTSNQFILYAGSAIYGFVFAACTVLTPILVRQVFGTREYLTIYPRINMFVNLMGAAGPVFWAFLGGFGYSLLFAVAIVILVIVLLLGAYSFAGAGKIHEQWHE